MSQHVFQVLKEANGRFLLDFIAESLALSKKQAKKLLDRKCVFVNEKRVWIASHELNVGDSVKVYEQVKEPLSKISEKDILFQDKNLFILNKPAGIVSNGERSAETFMRSVLKSKTIFAVHRLDRDTSGCLLFAFNKEGFEKLIPVFKDKGIRKTYHVIVAGRWSGGKRTISAAIDGRSAVSHVQCLKVFNDYSLLEVEIETGRTHQIRKHLLSIEFPVLGDKEYTNKRSLTPTFRSINRQMLHARSLEFVEPFDGKMVRVVADYPQDFISLIVNAIHS